MPQKHKTRPYSKVLAHLHKHNNENIIGHVSIHTQANFHVFEYTFSAGGPGLSFHTPFAVIITRAVSPLEIWKGYTPFKVNIWIGAHQRHEPRGFIERKISYILDQERRYHSAANLSRSLRSCPVKLGPKACYGGKDGFTMNLVWRFGWVDLVVVLMGRFGF